LTALDFDFQRETRKGSRRHPDISTGWEIVKLLGLLGLNQHFLKSPLANSKLRLYGKSRLKPSKPSKMSVSSGESAGMAVNLGGSVAGHTLATRRAHKESFLT